MKSRLTIKGKIQRLINDSISADRTTQRVMELVDEFAHEYADFVWPDYMEAFESAVEPDKQKLLNEFKRKQIALHNEKANNYKKRFKAVQSPEDSTNPILDRYLRPEVPRITESE